MPGNIHKYGSLSLEYGTPVGESPLFHRFRCGSHLGSSMCGVRHGDCRQWHQLRKFLGGAWRSFLPSSYDALLETLIRWRPQRLLPSYSGVAPASRARERAFWLRYRISRPLEIPSYPPFRRRLPLIRRTAGTDV